MMMTNGNLPFTDAQKKNAGRLRSRRQGADRRALRVAHLLQLSRVRRNARRLLQSQPAARHDRRAQGRGQPKHPATKMLGASWPLVDEFYLFGTAPWDAARPDDNIDVLFKNKIPMGFSRDKVHVLLSLDTERMDMTKQPNLKRGGDYPQAWTQGGRQGPHVLHLARPSRRHLEQRSGVPRAHQRGHSMGARTGAVALGVWALVACSLGPALDIRLQAPAPGTRFHHLHLNSINPEAAIEFYTKAFPSTSKGTFAGQPALRSPNNVWVLFNKVAAPPATQPQTAFWHFGWHVTDVRATLDRYLKHEHPAAAALHRRGQRGTVFVSSDTYPGIRRRARTDRAQASPRRRRRASSRPAARASPTCADPTMRSSSIRATCRRSASITCTCIRSSRSARSSGIRRT